MKTLVLWEESKNETEVRAGRLPGYEKYLWSAVFFCQASI